MPRRLVSWPLLRRFAPALFLILSRAAHADAPISTTTGSDGLVRALAFPQEGGCLLLAWVHWDADLGGSHLQWKLFGGSFRDTLPAHGQPLVTSPGFQSWPALASVAPAGCPPGSLCPSAIVAYED